MQKVKVQLENNTVEAVLVNERHAIFIEGDTVWMVAVNKADTNLYQRTTDMALVMLAEGIVVNDENETLEDIEKALNEITLLDYLTKFFDTTEDINFRLIKEGQSKVKF